MILETDRTVIRYFKPDDIDDLYEILSDEETMIFIEPVNTYKEVFDFLSNFCVNEKKALAVENKHNNKMIGYVLFKETEVKQIYEIGWIFNRKYWNQGYAYEACSSLINYAFCERKIHKIIANTIDYNKSKHLMEKLGMNLEGIQKDQIQDNYNNWVDYYLYGILRNDYLNNKKGNNNL